MLALLVAAGFFGWRTERASLERSARTEPLRALPVATCRSRSGKHFLIADPRPLRSAPFVVVQNWQGLLNQQVE